MYFDECCILNNSSGLILGLSSGEARSSLDVCCCVCVPEGPLRFPVLFGSCLLLIQPSILLLSLLPLLPGPASLVHLHRDSEQGMRLVGRLSGLSLTRGHHRMSNRRRAHPKQNNTEHHVTQRPLQNYY